jgi:hypothetical protein
MTMSLRLCRPWAEGQKRMKGPSATVQTEQKLWQ